MAKLKITAGFLALFILLSVSTWAQLNKTTSKVTFLFFHVTNNKGEYIIDLRDKKIIEGDFKVTPTAQDFEKEANHLLVSVIDNVSGKTEFEIVAANPVNMNLEYVNEKDQYDHANVKLQEGDFDVKIPMSDTGKTILVQLIQEDKSLLTLKTIK